MALHVDDHTCPHAARSWRQDRLFSLHDEPGHYDIYVMNADGSGGTYLTNNSAVNREPAWSPDGSKIAFSSLHDSPGIYDIYVMNVDGSGGTYLTNNRGVNREPAWSPDGSKIAFFLPSRQPWHI